MTTFGKIIQNLQVKIQELSENGDNKNGEIDTTHEKNELAQLLAGANQEIGDLYKSKKESLINNKNNMSQNRYEEQYAKLKNDNEMAMSKIENLSTKLLNTLKGYEQALKQKKDYQSYIETAKIIDNQEYIAIYPDNDAIPDRVAQKDSVFKVRANNSYEEKLNESENAFNIVVKDENGHEIGRKSYTKSKKAIYTNKEAVAKNCGLSTKESIDEIKTGPLTRTVLRIIFFPLASRMFEGEDNKIGALNQLNDDEAMNVENGVVYKWNPKTNEYERVGNIGYSDDDNPHNPAARIWYDKTYN